MARVMGNTRCSGTPWLTKFKKYIAIEGSNRSYRLKSFGTMPAMDEARQLRGIEGDIERSLIAI